MWRGIRMQGHRGECLSMMHTKQASIGKDGTKIHEEGEDKRSEFRSREIAYLLGRLAEKMVVR